MKQTVIRANNEKNRNKIKVDYQCHCRVLKIFLKAFDR